MMLLSIGVGNRPARALHRRLHGAAGRVQHLPRLLPRAGAGSRPRAGMPHQQLGDRHLYQRPEVLEPSNGRGGSTYSLGTGFDAPPAFVLASMRTVMDKDGATQFIGNPISEGPRPAADRQATAISTLGPDGHPRAGTGESAISSVRYSVSSSALRGLARS